MSAVELEDAAIRIRTQLTIDPSKTVSIILDGSPIGSELIVLDDHQRAHFF